MVRGMLEEMSTGAPPTAVGVVGPTGAAAALGAAASAAGAAASLAAEGAAGLAAAGDTTPIRRTRAATAMAARRVSGRRNRAPIDAPPRGRVERFRSAS